SLGLPLSGWIAAVGDLAGEVAGAFARDGDRDRRKGADTDHAADHRAGLTTGSGAPPRAAFRAILVPEGLAAARQDAHAEALDVAIPKDDLAGYGRGRAVHCSLGQLLCHGRAPQSDSASTALCTTNFVCRATEQYGEICRKIKATRGEVPCFVWCVLAAQGATRSLL